MKKVLFYMKKEADETWINIESTYTGLRYKECKGLEDKGKPKNIYTESYADSDTLRVYMPDVVLRESTTITFSFVFVGEDRKSVYEQFFTDVSNGKLYYYDTARKKKAYMILKEAITITEDVYKGSTPYMIADFKFTNLWGECKPVDEDGNEI